jgi:hypothetical protein
MTPGDEKTNIERDSPETRHWNHPLARKLSERIAEIDPELVVTLSNWKHTASQLRDEDRKRMAKKDSTEIFQRLLSMFPESLCRTKACGSRFCSPPQRATWTALIVMFLIGVNRAG